MIGIIGALDIEVRMLISVIDHCTETQIGATRFYSGALSGHAVVIAECGVGKVHAALCAQSMLIRFSPDMIINTGVAGGLAPDLRVGDIVLGTCAYQHDFDCRALGVEPGLIPGVNLRAFSLSEDLRARLARALRAAGVRYVEGAIATGDQFIDSEEARTRIIREYGAAAAEMEGCAIAQACQLFGVPCAVLRAISDKADSDAHMSFASFAQLAADQSVRVLRRFIDEM